MGAFSGVGEPEYLSVKEAFGKTEQDTGPNPYRGEAIGTAISIAHVNSAGEQFLTQAGASKPNSKDQSAPEVTKVCLDTVCRLCFEPVAVTYHIINKKNAREVEVDTQSSKLCGPKKYVACEDYACKICTAEAVVQRQKSRMLAIRGESVWVKRERDALVRKYGNASMRAWRWG